MGIIVPFERKSRRERNKDSTLSQQTLSDMAKDLGMPQDFLVKDEDIVLLPSCARDGKAADS